MKILSITKAEETATHTRFSVMYKPTWYKPVTRDVVVTYFTNSQNKIHTISYKFADTCKDTPFNWRYVLDLMVESKNNIYEINKPPTP